ncbi:MAG: hypothetical protein ACI9FD_002934 [Gammaproteobacteria bacterium]|jgi:hypothetical protein
MDIEIAMKPKKVYVELRSGCVSYSINGYSEEIDLYDEWCGYERLNTILFPQKYRYKPKLTLEFTGF